MTYIAIDNAYYFADLQLREGSARRKQGDANTYNSVAVLLQETGRRAAPEVAVKALEKAVR